MVHWQLGLQLVHTMCSLATSCGLSPLVTDGRFLTWCSSWIYASVGMAWRPWAPNAPVSTTWSLRDGFGEDLQSILHLVTRTSRTVNAADVVARSDLICILYFQVALGPGRTRQDVTGLLLGLLHLESRCCSWCCERSWGLFSRL